MAKQLHRSYHMKKGKFLCKFLISIPEKKILKNWLMKFERISELLLSTDYLDTGFEPEKHLTEKYIPLLKIDKYTYYILILPTSNVTYSTKNIYLLQWYTDFGSFLQRQVHRTCTGNWFRAQDRTKQQWRNCLYNPQAASKCFVLFW